MNGTTSNAERPPRITKPHRNLVFRGINGMWTYTSDIKAVYKEILHLDQLKPDGAEPGCYAGAEILSERLGISKRNVEIARRRLKARGFLVSKDRPGHRNDAWYATLPVPLPAAPIYHPTPEQGMTFSKQLDEANSGTRGCTSMANSPTRTCTSVGNSSTPACRSHIKRTELTTSTEPSTEPTTCIREEEGLDILETFKKKWRDENGHEPTREDIVRFAPTGWDR